MSHRKMEQITTPFGRVEIGRGGVERRMEFWPDPVGEWGYLADDFWIGYNPDLSSPYLLSSLLSSKPDQVAESCHLGGRLRLSPDTSVQSWGHQSVVFSESVVPSVTSIEPSVEPKARIDINLYVTLDRFIVKQFYVSFDITADDYRDEQAPGIRWRDLPDQWSTGQRAEPGWAMAADRIDRIERWYRQEQANRRAGGSLLTARVARARYIRGRAEADP